MAEDRNPGRGPAAGPPTRPFDPSAAEETAPLPPPGVAAAPLDPTRTFPAADGDPTEPPDRWSATAVVPPRGPVPATQSQYWVETEPEAPPGSRGPWLAPVLIAIVALVLLALLGTGVWLIVKSRQGGPPAAQPSSVPATTLISSPATTAPPTTAAPTTRAPTTTAPAQVGVPPVEGLTENQARVRLVAAGLRVQVVRQVDQAPPGTVLGTDPPAGTQVAAGTVVRLFVAVAPPTPSSSASSSR
jgi:PASTA domain